MKIKEIVATITKKEWHYVILLSVLVILITAAPYLYACLSAPEGYFYNGLHSLTPGDSPVYFSYINQIKAGNLVLRDYFTSELQEKGLINFFWLKVGLFARIFNLPADIAFHVFRLILIPIFLVILYIFISYFFKEKNKRKVSLFFICFASGIGAYFAGVFDVLYPFDQYAFIYKWPVDLWMPEANIFLTLYQTPHFIASLTLLVCFFCFMLLALENKNYFYSFLAGLVGLIWFNFHPFYFPYVFAILLVYFLILICQSKKISLIWHYFLALILSLPFVFYHYYKIQTDLVIGERASQNLLPTPPVLFVFLGFGFLLIFALAGLYYLIRNRILFKDNKKVFLAAWLFVGLILIYSPVFFQRRFLQGLEIPVIFFAIIFFYDYSAFFKKYFEKNLVLAIFFFIIIFGFSTLFNLVRDLSYYKNNLNKFYLPIEYKEATNWLEENNSEDKIILSYEINGQFIPAFVNQQVYLAHGIETINYKEKKEKTALFFASQLNEQEDKDFLEQNNIGYIFYSDWERQFAQFQPAEKKYLEKVFNKGQIEIYKIKKYD